MKYLYKIGNIETWVYDDSVNYFADTNNGTLTKEQILHLIQKLGEYGNKYWAVIDSLSLLTYFMDKESVESTTVVDKEKKWDWK